MLRGNPADLPPIVSLLHVLLQDLGNNVRFVSSASCGLASAYDRLTEYILPEPALPGPAGKALHYLQFRRFVSRTLKREAQSDDLIWFGSLDTALAMAGSPVLQRHPYILHLHELYDTHPRRLQMAGPIARGARRVVAPEINRAAILQVWMKLRRRPAVLPNKPFGHPQQRRIAPSTPATRKILERYSTDKPIVIYQGHLSADRTLTPLAKAMRALPHMQLWLMGKDHGALGDLLTVSENIHFLGHIPAPLHLEITSHATIGTLCYDPISLNNVFCAPNKIWEYAGFGIPFISNCAPSLLGPVRQGVGVMTEMQENSIYSEISKIYENYQFHSKAAYNFFKNQDNAMIVRDILS